MKARFGFVSNSSSSSFLVIATPEQHKNAKVGLDFCYFAEIFEENKCKIENQSLYVVMIRLCDGGEGECVEVADEYMTGETHDEYLHMRHTLEYYMENVKCYEGVVRCLEER